LGDGGRKENPYCQKSALACLDFCIVVIVKMGVLAFGLLLGSKRKVGMEIAHGVRAGRM
jgi:hypothetical protein